MERKSVRSCNGCGTRVGSKEDKGRDRVMNDVKPNRRTTKRQEYEEERK